MVCAGAGTLVHIGPSSDKPLLKLFLFWGLRMRSKKHSPFKVARISKVVFPWFGSQFLRLEIFKKTLPPPKMQMPYQCMTSCGNILVAARGSSIDAFKLQDGSLLSTWTDPQGQSNQDSKKLDLAAGDTTKLATQTSKSSIDIALDAASPPAAKKRKLSAGNQSAVQPEDKEGKRKQNNRSSAIASGLNTPAVTVLVSTTDGKHVIAVTGEDKCIRVFENSMEGVHQLKQLSKRYYQHQVS